jgi:integrase
MVEGGLAQKTVNRRLGMLKRVFKWAASEELVPPGVYQALSTVGGLRRGRMSTPDSRPVRPVPQAHIDAVRPHVSRQVWALVQLQLLTAARPGELVGLRPCDIDQSGTIWLAQPHERKTAHHGHARVIYMGPRAQELLRPLLSGRSPWSYLFSPAEAEEERRKRQHAERRTPLSCGNRPGTNRRHSPKRTPGEHYTVDSYRRAIQRACELASVTRWHPHQLRHNAATYLRKEFGLDAARIILGHRSPAVTDMYAELDREKALEIMAQIG